MVAASFVEEVYGAGGAGLVDFVDVDDWHS